MKTATNIAFIILCIALGSWVIYALLFVSTHIAFQIGCKA